MTILRQLFLGASLLFLLVLAGIEAIYLSNARVYLQLQLESHSQDTATSLSLWLATLPNFDDRALIETAVNATFDRGYFEQIRVVSVKGETLVSKQLAPAQGEVPQWFARLLPLRAPSSEALITSAWQQRGRVLVTSHPHFAYRQLWHTWLETLGWLALAFVATLAALRVFLASILRPLAEIERTAAAIGERNFSTIENVPRTRELAQVVGAINRLSGKVRIAIEEETEHAEQLRREAYLDSVTGLANRRGFEHQYFGLLGTEHDVFSGSLALFQLANFKDFNDQHGYKRGDDLLILIGNALTETCKDKPAICARFGGAVFAVGTLNTDPDTARKLVIALCGRVASAIAEQPLSETVQFHCGAVYFDHIVPTLPELLSAADLALTGALLKGPNEHEVIAFPDADSGPHGALAWRESMERALDSGRLRLYAQPVLAFPGGTLLHREVFARVLNDKGEMIPAAQFFPMMARHGLAPRLDCRVLETLLARNAGATRPAPRFAVNVSAQTIANAASLRLLIDLLSRSSREATTALVFEMTEFGAMQNSELTMSFAESVRQLGAGFAIDNFGLHGDSLRQLHSLLPDYLKLAPTYMRDLADNRDSRFLVESLIRIARPLEIAVIAQAVEDESLVPLLENIGFAGYQGYAAGRPEPIGD